jgi:hypothetical protein
MASRWVALVVVLVPAVGTAASDVCRVRCQDIAAVAPPARPASPTHPGAGSFVAYDPVERQIVPASPHELQPAFAPALQRALDRTFDGLVEVRRPDGSAYVHLGGRWMAALVVRVGPEGPITSCITSLEAARAFLSTPVATGCAPAPGAGNTLHGPQLRDRVPNPSQRPLEVE